MSPIGTVLRWASTIACAIVIVSFALFAIEQAKTGSKQELRKLDNINAPAPSEQAKKERARKHGDVREAIDKADDVLVAPFSSIVSSGSIWAKRGVAALLALLVYGVVARLLIAYLPGRT